MKLTVVVDNFCQKQGLLAEWGYSSWLKTKDTNILLDTAGICHVLTHNLNFLNLDPTKLSSVILSHGHFDHISGLMDILRIQPQVNVYASPAVSIEKRGDADAKRLSGGFPIQSLRQFRPIEGITEVAPDVFAFTVPKARRNPHYVCCRNLWEVNENGSIETINFEDDVSVAVKGNKGWSLLLGCSHAGLPNIMRYISEELNIEVFDTVVGGSHLCAIAPREYPLWAEKLSEFKVKRWRLNHCTGFKAAAAMAKYFDDVDWAGCGSVIEL